VPPPPETLAWLPTIRADRPARLRLFCLAHAGGGASLFARWPAALPAEIAVLPVQLPAHQQRLNETPYLQMTPLVEALTSVLLPHLDVPFALFGHSMGALVAFEFARQLRGQHGLQAACLLVSASRAPQLPLPQPALHVLPDAELIEAVAHRFGGVPEQLAGNAELMQLLLPALRADLSVVETYCCRDQPPLSCPITALGGTDDPEVSASHLAAWRQQTCGPFSLRMFPGGHFFLEQARRGVVQTVLRQLQPLLCGSP
jgi:medium-chain acyl-[acyl-carrier-protein] hydrolase